MKKILLVDSAREVLNQEKSFMNRANIKIFAARSGHEAIEIYRKELPDIVVLEFNLSDLTGIEVCKGLSMSALKKSPVLMVVEKGNAEILKACRDAGFDDFIFKPLNQKELLMKVGNLLNIPQREDFRILMKIKVEGKREKSFFMGSTIDISTSGMLLETQHDDINVGDNLECNFFLPWKLKAVNISCEITRKTRGKDGFRYGVRFTGLDSFLKKEIEEYIKKKERLSSL